MYKKRLKKLNKEPDYEAKEGFMLMGPGWETIFGESGFSADDMGAGSPVKQFYDKYAPALYEKWRQQKRPGDRPWCWWQFEAKESLAVIETGRYPEKVHIYNGKYSEENRIREWTRTETERQYLERLNLLENWEITELQHIDDIHSGKSNDKRATNDIYTEDIEDVQDED